MNTDHNKNSQNYIKDKILFISPPFGNYFPEWLLNKILNVQTYSITGSFTLEPRDGLFSQIIKTLRYTDNYDQPGWVNKIGFRNKGIEWGLDKYYNKENNIVSIGIINSNDINTLIKIIPDDANIEVNVSCPNVDKSFKKISETDVNKFLNSERQWCIIKLPPKIAESEIDYLYNNGWRQFHCSNTITVDAGGLSGKSIKPHSLQLSQYISTNYPDATVIAGGGIETIQDVQDYTAAGANHFSVSTLLFNPLRFINFLNDLSKS